MSDPQNDNIFRRCKVWLVANKIDKDPLASRSADNLRRARALPSGRENGQMAHYAEVSALEFTRVRKLFRDVLEDIVADVKVWGGDENILSARGSTGADGDSKCILQ